MILDPDTCMYDAHIYDPPSLTLMHVCMMHLSMILNHACMYGACIYDAANFVTDGRTNKAILGVGLSPEMPQRKISQITLVYIKILQQMYPKQDAT